MNLEKGEDPGVGLGHRFRWRTSGSGTSAALGLNVLISEGEDPGNVAQLRAEHGAHSRSRILWVHAVVITVDPQCYLQALG